MMICVEIFSQWHWHIRLWNVNYVKVMSIIKKYLSYLNLTNKSNLFWSRNWLALLRDMNFAQQMI